jgi:hypothetical protein
LWPICAWINKDRAVALGTRSCSEKCVSESRNEVRKKMRLTGRRYKTEFIVGEWNVRTPYQAGKYLLKNELDRFRYDVVGLCEVRWTLQEMR